MAGVKNIYIRNGDESFWDWAQEEADRKGVALSSWLGRLIQAQKYALGSKQIVEPTLAELLTEAESRIAEVRVALEKEET